VTLTVAETVYKGNIRDWGKTKKSLTVSCCPRAMMLLGRRSGRFAAKRIGLGLSYVEGVWTYWVVPYRGHQKPVQRARGCLLRRRPPPQASGTMRFWNGWTTRVCEANDHQAEPSIASNNFLPRGAGGFCAHQPIGNLI
jgi:hypothetical protein